MAAAERRVCVLTGASGRLGTEFIRRYSSRYDIAAIWCDNPPAVATQAQSFVDPLDPLISVDANRYPIFEIRADLTNPDCVDQSIGKVLAQFGKIDLLVNGAVRYDFGSICEAAHAQNLENQFNLNAFVPVRLASAVARQFWMNKRIENEAHNRNVVNISSVSALRLSPGRGAYSATKSALNTFSMHMAHEFAQFGVRVNVCAPMSFPQAVPTKSVATSIQSLDEGRSNGQVLVIEGRNERVKQYFGQAPNLIDSGLRTAQARPIRSREQKHNRNS